MSMRTLPLVFINLGGEMLYILDQRLQTQNTANDNTQKGVWSDDDRKRVMNDIIATMFSKAFMEELLKPQDLYSNRALRTVLTRLAHASIMRLNPASMDRLYELMVMAFKYQLLLCPRPRDLLIISYNHIDAIREFVRDTPSVLNQVDETHRKIIEVYTPLSDGEFQLLRQTLLIFLQDMHVRVSLFLKDKVQNPNGRFSLSTTGPVPHGTEVPGLIRMFSSNGKEWKRWEFPTGGSYTSSIRVGSFERFGDRVIRIGTNMYSVTQPEETHTSKNYSQKANSEPNPLAKEELNLLAQLLGGMKVQNRNTETGFRVNLFATDQEEEEAGASGGNGDQSFQVINIQATQDVQVNTELARIAGEFTGEPEQTESPAGPSNKGDNLLAMMDELIEL
ncbi:protein OSCP1-like [Salvelinus fontinalis]|uniref:protein OSCP1-like n=1 Tax=Salvelinus fontinalis TaxID=8038 RepID=UPI00248609CA|nr:protein OSCP1-like [Salvelinus fontinalis]